MPVYQYEGQHYDLPDGLTNEQAISKIETHLGKTPKEESGIGTGIKQAFASVGNSVDTGVSMLAGKAATMFGETDDADKIYKEMNQREASRNNWANPNNTEVSATGKIAGAVATLPQQLATFPLSPFTAGKSAIDAGESLGTAQTAQGIDVAGNMLGSLIGPGKTLYSSILKQGGANAAQDYITKWVTQQMMSTEEGKRIFNPTLVDSVVSGIVGGGMGAVTHPTVKTNKPTSTLDRMKAEEPTLAPETTQVDPREAFYKQEALRKMEEAQVAAKARGEVPMEVSPDGTAVPREFTGGNEAGVDTSGMRNPYDVSGDVTAQKALMEREGIDAQRQADAQSLLEQRQVELEAAVKRQATLDNNASERARQDAASAVSEAHKAHVEATDAARIAADTARMEDATWLKQQELFDQPEQGRVANPYEAVTGDWRVDENGMPIKADLSMDVANAENPTQRNLWGDELPQKHPQENSLNLPQAIDSMGWSHRRGALKKTKLGRELEAPGELLAAKIQADIAAASGDNLTGFNARTRRQGGGLLIGNKKVTVKKTTDGFEASIGDKIIGYLRSNLTPEQRAQLGETANVDIVKVQDDFKGKGVGKALYQAWTAANDGKVAPSGKTSKDAWKVWKRDNPAAVDAFVKQEATRIADGASESMVLGNITDPQVREQVSSFNARTRKQGGAIDPDVFLRDFPNFINSTIKDAAGKLKVLYHGTSKDAAFSDIKAGATGAWLTDNPKGASEYAKLNDSQKLKYNPDTRRFDELNTAARVMPVYANLSRPYKLSPEDLAIYSRTENYTKFQRELTAKAKSAGHDGIDWGDGIYTVFTPDQMKSALSPAFVKSKKKQSGKFLIGNKEKVQLDNALTESSDGTLIPDNPDVVTALEKARGEKDGNFNTYFQSGATNTAMKSGSTAIKVASRIVQNATKRVELAIRNNIFPAESSLKRLSRKEITDLSEIFKEEVSRGKRFSEDTLIKNLSVKQLEAYTHMREMFDKSMDAQNDARLSKGQDPITPHEAYMASRWQGDFRRPVFDKEGKTVWYLAANTKAGLEHQTKQLLKMQPDLVIDRAKDHQVSSSSSKTDLQSMYTTMLDILGRDDPAVQKVKEAVEGATMAEAESTRGQEKHFQSKGGTRGYIGDRPWQNAGADAIAMFQQQIQYAKNAFTWSEMQKAADDLKPIITDPVLKQEQPNNVKYIREYFKNAIGHGESKVTRQLSDTLRTGLGISPKVLSEGIGDVKSFFILQKLAASAGFTLANVIQTSNVIPYLADLRSQGFKGNPVTALTMGFTAGPMMMVSHYLKAAGGSYIDKLPNQFLKDAIRYAEDNGVTARSVYDESPIQTSFSPIANAANIAGKTMSVPETFVRSVAFMTYAQMLKSSGKYSDMKALFQHAEELVNTSMVDYRETEKPMVFSKAGAVGNFLNTLQTYPMSFYNQYSYMAGQAAKGNVVPLLAMASIGALMGGIGAVPYVEDGYQAYKWLKDNMLPTSAWASVNKSPFLSDPKLWVLETLGQKGMYGVVSDETGLGLSTRVSAPSLGNMLQSPIGPISDVAKQAGNVISAVTDPTNSTKWAQAAMSSSWASRFVGNFWYDERSHLCNPS
jgi:hypothetical protein